MRSARPEDKTVSDFGSKTENLREELPLLITRMGDWLVDMIAPVLGVRLLASLTTFGFVGCKPLKAKVKPSNALESPLKLIPRAVFFR